MQTITMEPKQRRIAQYEDKMLTDQAKFERWIYANVVANGRTNCPQDYAYSNYVAYCTAQGWTPTFRYAFHEMMLEWGFWAFTIIRGGRVVPYYRAISFK